MYPKLDVLRSPGCVLQFKYSGTFHGSLLGSPVVRSFECSHIDGGLCSLEREAGVSLVEKGLVSIFESCALVVN